MKKYQIIVTVEKCQGWQLYEVEANTKEEAIEKYNKGEGIFVDQEVEITELGSPEIFSEE